MPIAASLSVKEESKLGNLPEPEMMGRNQSTKEHSEASVSLPFSFYLTFAPSKTPIIRGCGTEKFRAKGAARIPGIVIVPISLSGSSRCRYTW